jgi:hypothetical protein
MSDQLGQSADMKVDEFGKPDVWPAREIIAPKDSLDIIYFLQHLVQTVYEVDVLHRRATSHPFHDVLTHNTSPYRPYPLRLARLRIYLMH